MKQGMSLNEMAGLVQYNSEAAKDYVVPVKNMEFNIIEDGIQYQAGVKDHGFVRGSMTKHAMRQITTDLNIPMKFADLLMEEDKPLLEYVMNERAHKASHYRMLRTINDKMVGNVSPSFSRLYDNDIILKSLLPHIKDTQFDVKSCNINDRMMHLSLTTEKLKGEVKIGDVVQGGIKMRNSGVGASRMMFARLAFRLWCLNGCTSTEVLDSYTRVHRGIRQPEGILYKDDTIQAHQNVIALEIRDTLTSLLDEDSFNRELDLMRATTTRKIKGDVPKAIEELGKIVGFNKDEGSGILKHLIEGGDLSQWGALNAITRYAQDVDSYDRSMELESVGGKVITLHENQWRTVAEAA